MKRTLYLLLGAIFIFSSCQSTQEEDEWIALFNGKDLQGWLPKIRGYELNDNFANTFRVEDGLMTVSYDGYEEFENRYGHIFYEKPFSHYLLRIEYRFIGEQPSDGEGWAFKNSGVMVHSQSPQSMTKAQDFPISLEAQFLGGNGEGERPTGNLCTPGTHVEIDGKLEETHCITANAPTYHGDEWVTLDVLVLGDELLAHIIDGDTLIKYSKPTIGGGVVHDFDSLAKPDGNALREGYIALQSESHPIQFRQVLLKDLSEKYDH